MIGTIEKTDSIVEVRRLKKYFQVAGGLLHAVDDVTVSIPRGKTLGLVGESGCGKSTLGRVVIGLIGATGGEIFFNGKDSLKYSPAERAQFRKHAQIVFQDPFSSLNPRMTVSQLIAEPMVINKAYAQRSELDRKVKKLMDTVGLAERLINSFPHELDGGRRQRIGIARALSLNPKFIVCDEPVSALDVSIQAQVLNLMQDLQENLGLTYMFITHNLSVVKHLSNSIMVMYLGQMVELADSRTLFKEPSHPYTQALLSAIPVPDPDVKMQRVILKGEITSPINVPEGCRFAKRCAYARPDCETRKVNLTEISPGHFVACRLFER